MDILFFGDVIGKIGRRALIQVLPQLKQEFKPDLVVANGENMAHGIGMTVKTVRQLMEAGVDCFTSGNHFDSKEEQWKELVREKFPVIRPANYARVSGPGWLELTVGQNKVCLINLLGQVFIERNKEKRKLSSPFLTMDRLLKKIKTNLIVLDFHAEATSEKMALAYYLDGRISALLGTHTHVPTADQRILPRGTAYISDLGMVGAKDSVIGADKEVILKRFLTKDKKKKIHLEIPEKGTVLVQGVLLNIGKDGRAEKIERIARETEIK